jgi:hypothetical protein
MSIKKAATGVRKLPDHRSVAPNTTIEDDKITAGQRRVNILWEVTQAIISIMITGAIIYNSFNNIKNEDLTNAFFLIVSMYFVRTNHQRVGGVQQNQTGR